MGAGSGGGTQTVVNEVPEEAKPFLYGSGEPGEEGYVQGLLPKAQELFTTPMPQYQMAGFTPMQQQAFSLAQQGVGSYQPYLDAASNAQMQGIQAGAGAIDQTKNLAGQISNEVGLGQQALGAAGQGVLSAAQQGQMAAQQGQQGVLSAAQQGQQFGTTGAQQAGAISEDLYKLGGAGTGQQLASEGVQKAEQAADAARKSTAAAQGQLTSAADFGRSAAEQGIAGLAGSAAQFDPSSISSFMSPYEDEAIQKAMQDIERAGQIKQQELGAQAVQAGAFGGSRSAIAEQELNRNVLEQQAGTAASMRQAGYESAAKRAQEAFEASKGRQQTAASTTGALGQAGAGTQISGATNAGQLGLGAETLAQTGALSGGQLGLAGLGQDVSTLTGAAGIAGQAAGLGMQGAGMGMQGAGQAAGLGMQGAGMGMQGAGQAGQLGAQAAGLGLQGIGAGLGAQQQIAGMGQGIAGLGMNMGQLGGMQQGMGMQDINLLSQLGAQQQGQSQGYLDMYRANQMLPYQNVGFFSDIIRGAPIGTAQTSFMPGPSPFQQAVGGAIAYQGLNQ